MINFKLNTQCITDSKTFWKKIKAFFTDKIQTKSKITLREKVVSGKGEKVITRKIEDSSEDKAIAEVFNRFFY